MSFPARQLRRGLGVGGVIAAAWRGCRDLLQASQWGAGEGQPPGIPCLRFTRPGLSGTIQGATAPVSSVAGGEWGKGAGMALKVSSLSVCGAGTWAWTVRVKVTCLGSLGLLTWL